MLTITLLCFHAVVVNKDGKLEETVQSIEAILQAESLSVRRRLANPNRVAAETALPPMP